MTEGESRFEDYRQDQITSNEFDNSDEREKNLKRELLGVQLQYAQRLFEKKIPAPSKEVDVAAMDFGDILEQFTDLSTKVKDAYMQRTGKDLGSEESYQEFKNLNEAITVETAEACRENPNTWINNIDEFVADAVRQLPQGSPALEKKPEEFRAGILRYSIDAGHYGLEKYGINPEDECVKTHLDPLFTQPEGGDRKLSELYKEAYAIIAKEIAESHPKVKALVSESWLFDTDLAGKIGLHIYPSSNENMFRGNTFWGQFINKEGHINTERVNQFLETGKPPFKVKSGYIPIEEFLHEYLS